MGTDQQIKADEAQSDPAGARESRRDGQVDQFAGKAKAILGDAADWASDRLKDVSDRLTQPAAHESGDVEVSVAHRPPAPVTGDAGARAAGKVKDDITDAADDTTEAKGDISK